MATRRLERGDAAVIAVTAPLIAAATLLAWAPPAQALPLHTLTPAGCIDTALLADCPNSTNGLNISSGVAVSPDGGSVYVVSQIDKAIVRLNRAADGSLTPAGCVEDPPIDKGCASSADGLAAATGVAVSPDGISVYVAARGDEAIVRFNRAPDGTLTPADCFEDTAAPSNACGASETAGLGGANGVAVSPDGSSVYVTSATNDAIVSFNRAADGTLTPAGCIEDTPIDVGCASATGPMNGPGGVVVSPDGASVYVASDADDSIARFNRAPTGALTPAGCFEDTSAPSNECGASETAGLDGAGGVAVSPDGTSVFVVSKFDNAIVRFARAPDGAIAPVACIEDPPMDAGCGGTADGLSLPSGVAVSLDGASVFVASNSDDAIVRFNRATDGSLNPAGCIEDPPVDAGCASSADGLDIATGVAVSPDGGAVYVVSQLDSAIVRFKREVPPICLGSTAAGPSGKAVSVPLDCYDPNGDPLTISVFDRPLFGTLGSVNQTSDSVLYTPNAAITGTDSFSFSAIADGKPSNNATAFVSIAALEGPQGQTGPEGPAGEAAIKLLVLLAFDKLAGKSGTKLPVRFATSGGGTAEVEVRRGSNTVIRRSLSLAGDGTFKTMLKLLAKRKPLKPGNYTLTLTVTGGDGQSATDSARLQVKR